MSAFGTQPFGNTAPWGGAGTISIITALCTGANKITVFFTGAPKALDWGGWQDATNPIYWSLTAIDPVEIGISGIEIVETGSRRPSFGVFIADILPDEDDPTQLVIRTAPQLEPGISYRVELVGQIRGVGCEEFAGLASFEIRARNKPIPRKDPQAAAVDTYRDWDNPYYVTDPRTGQLVEGPGTWQIDEAGDIVLSGNAESLRKRVLRVITTEAGAFAHLPEFGQRATVKSIARPDEVQRIASRLQEQIQQFSDVRSAAVEVEVERSPSGAGILRFRIAVQPRSEGIVRMVFAQPLK